MSAAAPKVQKVDPAVLKRFDAGMRELLDPAKQSELRKKWDAEARAENPDITDEQLDWTWRQAAEQFGL